MTAIDRRLTREAGSEHIVAAGHRDAFQHALRAGRLKKLGAMGLAHELGGGRWKLGDQLEARKADLAASTEAAIVEVLLKKSLAALKETGLKRLVVAGGVGANRLLREQLNAACAKRHVRVHYPELDLCTDNGAMIAMAAAMRLASGVEAASRSYAFDVKPRWPLAELSVA